VAAIVYRKLQTKGNVYRNMLANETLNKNVFSTGQKVERDAEDTMMSGKLFQSFGAATGNALLPTVCKRTILPH